MSDPAFKAMSIEEYLRTEEDSPVKREYVGGFVYPVNNSDSPVAQAGSSKPHAEIILNVVGHVRPAARRLGCRVYASEIKLRIEGRRSYYYPDVMVACGPDSGDDTSETTPCLLVEVLSRGTAHTDRNAKYGVYTSLPSLQTYLIVDQYERHVYAYHREGEEWTLTEYDGHGSIPLPYLDVALTLDDMYDGVLEN
ncbi:Uma2 family endonuclease [uncultured Deinococcus sp.]|uniref:Uma2 family endonuclease n=1 Tax=uncultured Deinococcus sp. TaxID=158789 RepID=UPI0025F335E2|nr:Uma2 family endonuclease [uncultured Deinococcus sp.]